MMEKGLMGHLLFSKYLRKLGNFDINSGCVCLVLDENRNLAENNIRVNLIG